MWGKIRAMAKSGKVLGHGYQTKGSTVRTLDRPETLLLEQGDFRPTPKLRKLAKGNTNSSNPAPGVLSGKLGADTSASGPPLRPPGLPVSSNL